MQFFVAKDVGNWSMAFGLSAVLHVIVLALLLATKGCGSSGSAAPADPGAKAEVAAEAGSTPSASSDEKAPAAEKDGKEKTPPKGTSESRKTPPPSKVESRKTPSKPPKAPSAAADANKGESPSPSGDGWKTYKVKPGDSLTRIARTCGCTVQELAKANGLSPLANLKLGQTIKIKDAGPAEE